LEEPIIYSEVGEEMHECGFCGTRTIMDDATYYACGARNHDCPRCCQCHSLTDEEDEEDEPVSLDGYDLGEIEVVDEKTGAVIGMTGPVEPLANPLPDIANLLEEATQDDLDQLFGTERPASWGSF
jgi:hypothetical protein